MRLKGRFDLYLAEIEFIIQEMIGLIPYFIPIILIELGLIVFAMVQLIKGDVRYLPKWGWVLIILFINIIGPIVFLAIGRKKYN